MAVEQESLLIKQPSSLLTTREGRTYRALALSAGSCEDLLRWPGGDGEDGLRQSASLRAVSSLGSHKHVASVFSECCKSERSLYGTFNGVIQYKILT